MNISISRNDEMLDNRLSFRDLVQSTCFESFDIENDILELRYEDDLKVITNWLLYTRISVRFISDKVTQLLFGLNADKPWINLGNYFNCAPGSFEAVSSLKVKNETIIQSACVGECITTRYLYLYHS